MNKKFISSILVIIIVMLLMIPTALANEYSEDDVILLAKLIHGEAEGESEAGKLMVAQCALDRLNDGYWGSTLKKVIRYDGQFSVSTSYTDEELEIAKRVLDGEKFDENLIILYFQKSKYTRDWYAPYLNCIGPHAYYGYIIEEKDYTYYEEITGIIQ